MGGGAARPDVEGQGPCFPPIPNPSPPQTRGEGDAAQCRPIVLADKERLSAAAQSVLMAAVSKGAPPPARSARC